MFAQKLRSSCKLISVSFGFITSYLTYQYQQTIGDRLDKRVNQNLDVIQGWMEYRSRIAYAKTESLLMTYCQWLSKSAFFHKMDMTSLLIFLAENRNTTFMHELCIKLLASIEFPQDVDIEYYLKKCDSSTLIGLARSSDVNLKWFSSELPRGIENKDKEEAFIKVGRDIEEVIHKIQQALMKVENQQQSEKSDRQECSSWLFQQVLDEHVQDDPFPNSMNDLSVERDHHTLNAEKPEIPLRKHLMNYLKILRQFSTNDLVTNDQVLSSYILDVVREVIELHDIDSFPDRASVLEKCGNIVANLSCIEGNQSAVIERNFLPILMRWKMCDDGASGSQRNNMLMIVADRVLTNLDTHGNHHKIKGLKRLCDGIYVFHPNCRSQDEAAVDVVFVHGIQGSPFYTWRQGKSEDQALFTDCWPKDWLPTDYPNIRVIGVHYESFFSDWFSTCPVENDGRRSLEVQAAAIKKKLEECGVGERPIVWVAHSLGGLITKRMLSLSNEDESNFLPSTKGVVFYSVPHLGSPFATKTGRARFVLFPSKEVSEIEHNSEKLQKLHQDFMGLAKRFEIDCLDFGESKPFKIPYLKYAQMVVPPESCNVGYGRFLLLDTNHQDVCKPVSKVDPRYWEVSAMVRKVMQDSNGVCQQNESFKTVKRGE